MATREIWMELFGPGFNSKSPAFRTRIDKNEL